MFASSIQWHKAQRSEAISPHVTDDWPQNEEYKSSILALSTAQSTLHARFNCKLRMWYVRKIRRNPMTKSVFSFIFFLPWPCCTPCRILVSQLGIKPVPPAVEALSLNNWTSRKVPRVCFPSHSTLSRENTCSRLRFSDWVELNSGNDQ